MFRHPLQGVAEIAERVIAATTPWQRAFIDLSQPIEERFGEHARLAGDDLPVEGRGFQVFDQDLDVDASSGSADAAAARPALQLDESGLVVRNLLGRVAVAPLAAVRGDDYLIEVLAFIHQKIED